ncbi:monocarboxylate transporter 13-like isoform X2 [Oscarella lobularis]|uniref:monocarboxylate transporter 13-like isoform X2 n=1 Tax=Oscarella lobularis TaxID=121494 RepID=UPI00331337D3
MDAASSLQSSAIETSSGAKERRSRFSFGLRLLRRPISTVDGCWSWIACISAFFITFFTVGLLESFSVLYIGFIDKFSPENETNSTHAKISGSVAWISSTSYIVAFCLSPLASVTANRFGIRNVLLLSSALIPLGLLLTSFTRQLWEVFFTYGVLCGLGTMFVFTPILGLLPAYFQKYRSPASGILMSSPYVSTATLVPLGRHLLDVYGLDVLLYVESGMTLLVLFPMAIIFRPHLSVETERLDQVQSLGKLLRNIVIPLKRKRFSFWLALIALHYFTYYIPIIHTIRFAEDELHVSPARSGYLMTCYALTAAVSNIFFGSIADRLPAIMLSMIVPILIGAIATLCFPFYVEYWHVMLFMFFIGVSVGFNGPIPVVVRRLVEENEAIDAVAILSLIAGFMSSLGPPVAGWIYDHSGHYTSAFIMSGSVSLTAGLLLFVDVVFFEKRSRLEASADIAL